MASIPIKMMMMMMMDKDDMEYVRIKFILAITTGMIVMKRR